MPLLVQQSICTGRALTISRRPTSSQRLPRTAKLAIRAEQEEGTENSPALSLPRRTAMQSAIMMSSAVAMSVFPEPSLATPKRKKVEKVSLKPPKTLPRTSILHCFDFLFGLLLVAELSVHTSTSSLIGQTSDFVHLSTPFAPSPDITKRCASFL